MKNFSLPQPGGSHPPRKTFKKPPKPKIRTQRLRIPRKLLLNPNPRPLHTLPSLLHQRGSPSPHPPRLMSSVRSARPPRPYPHETMVPSTTFPPEHPLPKDLNEFPPLHFPPPVTRQPSPHMTVRRILWISDHELDSLLHWERTNPSQANFYPLLTDPSF